MDEATFWTSLEGRVSRELAATDDRVARALWCDGFQPERYAVDDAAAPRIGGVTWLGVGGQDRRAFVLVLPRPISRGGEIPWEDLLPRETDTGWLSIASDGVVWVAPSRAEAVPVGAAHRVSIDRAFDVEPPRERWGRRGRPRRRGAS